MLKASDGVEKREEVLALMRSALGKIDEADGPHDVGAHLDLAICKLEEALAEAHIAKETSP